MLVLWLIVVLGFMAAGVTAVVRAESEVIVATRARTVARYAAESGVETAVTELRRLLIEARTPPQQARFFQQLDDRLAALQEVELGDARFQVTVSDLNARLDLNRAAPTMLRAFLAQFVGEGEAERLVAALEDWKDPDDEPREAGAEVDAYIGAGSPFRPPNRPLLRLDELTRIRGFADSLTYAIAPYVTVRGDERINVNTAPEPVLGALPALGTEGARSLIDRRESGQPFESVASMWDHFRRSNLSLGGQLRNVSALPARLLVISRGWQEGSPLTHEIQAVFDLSGLRFGDERLKLEVRHWTERDL
jgi:general secretion pathway protein K